MEGDGPFAVKDTSADIESLAQGVLMAGKLEARAGCSRSSPSDKALGELPIPGFWVTAYVIDQHLAGHSPLYVAACYMPHSYWPGT